MDKTDDYYAEAVEIALNDIGKPNLLNRDEMLEIAWSVLGNAENESTAFPSPSSSDIEHSALAKQKLGYEARIQELEAEIAAYQGSVARRRNVSPSDVYLDGNSVMIRA